MMASSNEKRIMCVGLCCLDIVNVCPYYPIEDSVKGSLDYYWQRGGNASNSCTVLSLLGSNPEFVGTLVKTPEYEFMVEDFAKYNIHIGNCAIYEENTYRCPVAVIVINIENGSRTVMAALKNIIELQYSSFEKIDLKNYSWIHFEGRNNMENTEKMMMRIIEYNKTVDQSEIIKISIELEKIKTAHIVPLMKYADYVFISKDFAKCFNYYNKEDTVKGFIKEAKPGGVVICAWGEDGAAAFNGSHDIVTSNIFPPEKVIDTLGAGDTFNASTVLALNSGKSIKEAITYGCKVAGAKCGVNGYDGIKGMQSLL
ncbi:hypothetical protein ACF0H5_017104 [Mactra antiquata]